MLDAQAAQEARAGGARRRRRCRPRSTNDRRTPTPGGSAGGGATAPRVREPVRQQRRAEPPPRGSAARRRPAQHRRSDAATPSRLPGSRRSTRSPTPSCAPPRATAECVAAQRPTPVEPATAVAVRPRIGEPTGPSRTGPISAVGPLHRVLEGTVIDAVLTNRLDGGAAAPVNCLVTNPVYSHSGQHVLIPAGARVLGETRPVQTLGETRLAVAFHRLLMPDGSTVAARPVPRAEPDRRLGSARSGEPPLLVHVRRGGRGRPRQRSLAAARHRRLRAGRRQPHRGHRRQRRGRDGAGQRAGDESVPEPAAHHHDSRRAPREGLRHERSRPARVVAARDRPTGLQRR